EPDDAARPEDRNRQPASVVFDSGAERPRKEQRPRQQPEQRRDPEAGDRERNIVDRLSRAEEAPHVFVDDVEVDEGRIAHRHRHVPGQEHDRENRHADCGAQPAPETAPLDQEPVGRRGDDRKEKPDEPLGQAGQRHAEVEGDRRAGSGSVPRNPGEAVERKRRREYEQSVGENEASKEKRADRRRVNQRSQWSRCGSGELVGDRERDRGSADEGKRARHARGEIARPEPAVRSGDGPVEEGRLRVVAHVVEAWLNPVPAFDHLAGDQTVTRLGGAEDPASAEEVKRHYRGEQHTAEERGRGPGSDGKVERPLENCRYRRGAVDGAKVLCDDGQRALPGDVPIASSPHAIYYAPWPSRATGVSPGFSPVPANLAPGERPSI